MGRVDGEKDDFLGEGKSAVSGKSESGERGEEEVTAEEEQVGFTMPARGAKSNDCPGVQ
jgi:hypothetical protein